MDEGHRPRPGQQPGRNHGIHRGRRRGQAPHRIQRQGELRPGVRPVRRFELARRDAGGVWQHRQAPEHRHRWPWDGKHRLREPIPDQGDESGDGERPRDHREGRPGRDPWIRHRLRDGRLRRQSPQLLQRNGLVRLPPVLHRRRVLVDHRDRRRQLRDGRGLLGPGP